MQGTKWEGNICAGDRDLPDNPSGHVAVFYSGTAAPLEQARLHNLMNDVEELVDEPVPY
jgi:hypothetical protein